MTFKYKQCQNQCILHKNYFNAIRKLQQCKPHTHKHADMKKELILTGWLTIHTLNKRIIITIS